MSSRVAPVQSGNRLLDQFGREVRKELAEVDLRLTALEAANDRIMPLDQYAFLYWPCDDVSGSGILRNTTSTAGGALTVVTAGTATEAVGYVQRNAVRLYDSTTGNKGASGGAAVVPASAGVTLSFWARLGQVSGTNNLVGYWENGAGAIFAIKVINGVPTGVVQNLAGTQTISGTTDMIVSPGEWHHYGLGYSGQAAYVLVDGVFASQGAAATSAINWTFGASTRLWRVGYTGSASNAYGWFQDIRVDSCARNGLWFREAYERSIGELGRVA